MRYHDPHDDARDPIEEAQEYIRHEELHDRGDPFEQEHALHIQQPPPAFVDVAYRECGAFMDMLANGLLEEEFRNPFIQSAPMQAEDPFAGRFLVAIGKLLHHE